MNRSHSVDRTQSRFGFEDIPELPENESEEQNEEIVAEFRKTHLTETA